MLTKGENMALTKSDIVASIAKDANLTNKDAAAALDAFVSTFKTAIKKDGEFGITGLFKATVKATPARSGTSPVGGSWSKPAGKTVRIAAGKVLKDLV
jgi:DNA-binding protein HU-beta